MAEANSMAALSSDVPPQPSLLTTKLHIPLPHPNLIPRLHLIQRLNASLARKLFLISAPAGFGKTALLGQWIRQSEMPVAWVSLDESDNDLRRFLFYVITALQMAYAGIGEAALTMLQSPGITSAVTPHVESLLTTLINEIVTTPEGDHDESDQEGRAYALVLDDYHTIGAQPIHDALTFLLEHMPEKMHLVLASRTDPPLPLARLRARGQLTELHAPDLRFTPDQASAFLNQVMELGLSAEDVAALEMRTEGWIAGLQLAALSMKGHEDISGFIKSFTGEHHYILDYLAEEVLQRQSEHVQSFLLKTSILDRLNGPLCEAVTGHGITGQMTLERLESANLFIVPLDDRRRWYRYHQLFADFLRDRLRQTYRDQVPALHRRASEWHEAEGLMDGAIGHALEAEDFERAARLVERLASTGAIISEPTRILGWLETLPLELVRSRPGLCISYAMALVEVGQLDVVEPHLQAAERAIEAEAGEPIAPVIKSAAGLPDIGTGEGTHIENGRIETYLGQLAAIRSIVACYSGDPSSAVELSRQALEHLPEDNLFWRGGMAINIALNLAGAYRSSTDVIEATQALAQAAEVSRAAGDLHTTLFTRSKLADLQKAQGRLHQAAETYRQSFQLTTDQRGWRLPAAGRVYAGMGALLYEWNDIDAARQHLLESIELGKRGGDPEILVEGYVTLARVNQARGDMDGAVRIVQKAEQLARTSDIAWMAGQVGACQARLWMAQGNTAAAARWAKESGPNVGVELGYKREDEYTTLARVRIAENRPDQALEMLAWLLGVTDGAGLTGMVIETLALQALALQAKGDRAQANTVLERALSLTEPEGYIRVFVDEGAPMFTLLRQAASRGIAWDYVGKLLGAFEPSPIFMTSPPRETASGVQPLLELLSERELEVLRLIAVGASNREIAQDLFVTVGTVKKHINNMFGKLDVHSRTRAVARARELNLLP